MAQATPIYPQVSSRKRVPKSKRSNIQPTSPEAIEEINAYIMIRDGLLAEAEKVTNSQTLQRASIANDFLASFLRPGRPPYEAQFLTEAQAVRERERCETVKLRIAELGQGKRK